MVVSESYVVSKTVYECDFCYDTTDYPGSDWKNIKGSVYLCPKCLKNLGFGDCESVSMEDYKEYMKPMLAMLFELSDRFYETYFSAAKKLKHKILELSNRLKENGKVIPNWL